MSDNSIERRAVKNTVVGAISFVLTLCQTLLLVPVLLKYWGNANYGLWLTLMAGFSLLQTVGLGHHNYVGNQLNVQYHADLNEFRRTLGSGLLIAYFLGLVEMAVCLFFIVTGTLPQFLGVPSHVLSDHQVPLGLLLLMTMWLIFGSVGGIIGRILIPAGMLYESQWLGIVVRLTQFLSIVVIAVCGGNILAACLWYAILQSAMSFVIFWYVKVSLPQFYPWWQAAQWGEGLRNLQKSLALTLIGIGGQLSNNGLLILLSALFTSAVIPAFSTLRTLTNTAGAVTTIFSTALLPDMVRFHATRDASKLSRVFSANWFISGICVNFGIILVLPVIETIFRIWTRGILSFNSNLFILLAVAISLANFGGGLIVYLSGINDLRSQAAMTATRVIFLFLIGYSLSDYCGILSIGIGCVVSEMLASVVLPLVFVNRRLAEFSRRLAFKDFGLAMLPPLSLLLAALVIIVENPHLSFVALALLPLLCGVYYINWKILDSDVKNRISKLAFSAMRSFGMFREGVA